MVHLLCHLLKSVNCLIPTFTNDDGSLPPFAHRVKDNVLMAPITFSLDVVLKELHHFPSKCSKSHALSIKKAFILYHLAIGQYH